MKTYTIVSTYPHQGSKNIGDYLISESTKNAISYLKGDNVKFNVVWRKAKWEEIKESVKKSDAIIFACLAIRKDLGTLVYPYLEEILQLDIPLGVLSAGTSLHVNAQKDMFDDIPYDTIKLLKRIEKKSLFFTTRAALTQAFCRYHGINSEFSGDIAFFDNRYNEYQFKTLLAIKKIGVSDPHYANLYFPSFQKLLKELKKWFSSSDIIILLHGKNPTIEAYCLKNNIQYKKIYEDIETGLDAYDDIDIHVGFRVHGHVSTLKRRKPSYLLEQDGRGVDYGLTFSKRLSVPHFYNSLLVRRSIKDILRLVIKQRPRQYRSLSDVEQMIAMIKIDQETHFKKFKGFEKEISAIIKNCFTALKKLP